ncbi:hypothetical protein ACHAXA_004013 [Cyclostephanos tholiformis]|uniref:Uncharacterized protein n=1 Tax=Cyclostephanos tholiformis TaxID=382380 RepID=A0ABD3S025_9STRA
MAMPVPEVIVGSTPKSAVTFACKVLDGPPPESPRRRGEILPPPPPDTPTTPAIDGYYSIFGDDLEANNESSPYFFPAGLIYTFCYWYSTKMDERPVLTKSITGGCSSIVGDILAQYIENGSSLRTDSSEGLYYRRILAMFCTGLSYGPMLHYIYEFYEHVLPIDIDEQISQIIDKKDSKCKNPNPAFVDNVADDVPTTHSCHSTMFHSYYTISHRKLVNAFVHVLVDQGLMAFFFVAVMMFITGVVEGHWKTLAKEFERDYIENIHRLWVAALLAIGPIQLLAFRLLSLKWRAVAVSLLDVFEVSMMSYITHRNRECPSNDDP